MTEWNQAKKRKRRREVCTWKRRRRSRRGGGGGGGGGGLAFSSALKRNEARKGEHLMADAVLLIK